MYIVKVYCHDCGYAHISEDKNTVMYLNVASYARIACPNCGSYMWIIEIRVKQQAPEE